MKGRYAGIHVRFAAARAQVPTQNDAILEGITRGSLLALAGELAPGEGHERLRVGRLHGLVRAEAEGGAQRVEIAVMFHMLGVDIGDQAGRDRQALERAVAFIGFDDHPAALTQFHIGAKRVDDAAVDDCRIEVRLFKNMPDQRGCRGFAMRPGDADGPFQAHDLGEEIGAFDDRDVQRTGGFDFRVAVFNSGGNDDGLRVRAVGAFQVLGLVAHHDADAGLGQTLGVGAVILVGALHGQVQRTRNLGQAGHADAANAYKMQRCDLLREGGHAAFVTISSAKVHAAFGLPRAFIAAAILGRSG